MINCLILCLIISAISFLKHNHPIVNIPGKNLPFEYTNILRGLAIMMIMVGHISGTMGTVVLSPFGGTGVALFLFISGFGINESWKKSKATKYWTKKVKRVFIPYFITITILVIIKKHMLIYDYALDILGIKTSYWYIGFLLKWYLIFWISAKYFFSHRMPIMCICSIFFLFILPNIEAEQSFSFIAGVLVSENASTITGMSRKRILSIGLIALVFGTIFLAIKQSPLIRAHIDDFIYNIVQLFIKLPYAISIMCVVWSFPTILQSRFLRLSGAISYELYLVHMPFFGMVNGSLLNAILLILCSICVAKAFNIANKRICNIEIARFLQKT